MVYKETEVYNVKLAFISLISNVKLICVVVEDALCLLGLQTLFTDFLVMLTVMILSFQTISSV